MARSQQDGDHSKVSTESHPTRCPSYQREILHNFTRGGYPVTPETTLFIDDDRFGRYRQQMVSIKVHFLQKGVDIQDLSELLDNPLLLHAPVQKSLL